MIVCGAYRLDGARLEQRVGCVHYGLMAHGAGSSAMRQSQAPLRPGNASVFPHYHILYPASMIMMISHFAFIHVPSIRERIAFQ